MKPFRIAAGLMLGLVLTSLSACAAAHSRLATAPTSTPTRVQSPTTAPALPSATLPPTWTPAPTRSPRPSPTPWEAVGPTATPTLYLVPTRWSPAEIPAVTLTPAGAVPLAAQHHYDDALRAYAGGNSAYALELLDEALALAPDHPSYW